MIKCVLWDWNGTLLDDVEVNLRVVNNMLHDRGIDNVCDRQFYRDHFRFPVFGFYKDVGFSLDGVDFDAVAAEYVRWYTKLMPQAKTHEGVRETLGELNSRGIRQIILSATQRENLRVQVEHYGLSGCFEQLLGVSDSRGNGKLHVAQEWLKTQDLKPEEIVMVGDTDHDYEVSGGIGCKCVLIANGHQSAKVLMRTGTKVIPNIRGLIAALEEL